MRYAELLGASGIVVPEVRVLLDAEPRLLGFGVESAGAVEMWESLRAATDRTGLYPVILAGVDMLEDAAADAPPVEEILAKAAELDVPRWLKWRARENLEGLDEGDGSGEAEPNNSFVLPFDINSGKPRDDLSMALLPTRSPWEAAAYHLGWTGVNYDLEPEHHVAVHKYWHERYGAELVTAAIDTMEMRVTRPPRDYDAAMKLAREQGGYCPDIIMQGVETLDALAKTVLAASAWYFWWD